MKIILQGLKVLLISILLILVWIILRQPHRQYYDAEDKFIYSHGSAPDHIRGEILEQLKKFQDGYTHRDTDRVEDFMEELFSQQNILVLGTMPDEIYTTYEDVSDLIFSDWNAWGDCTFLMDTAHISSAGNAAWISTIGYVEFDLSRFLVLPLRLSAVMVEEDLGWKFQSMQFQFDLTLFPLFLVIPLLAIMLVVSLASLIVMIVRRIRGTAGSG